MRTLGLVLFGLILSITCRADEAPAEAKQTERLKQVLDEWEKAASSVKEMHYHFTLTKDDRTFGTKTVTTGQVFIKMPELIRLDETDAKGETTYYLYEKRQLHCFEPESKTERIFPLSEEFGFPEHPEKYPDKGGDFLLGTCLEGGSRQYLRVPLREMEANCDLRLTKEDKNWIYLEFTPRSPEYMVGIMRYVVVLDAQTYQIRMLWHQRVDDNRVQVDIEKRDTKPNPPITSESIRKGLPTDWKQEKIPDPAKASP
jgi:hypothetical protein